MSLPKSVQRQAWFIHLNTGVIHAESIAPPVPDVSRGESATYSFRLYTTIHKGDDPPPVADHLDRYRELLELNEHANSYISNATPTNQITYMEQTPASANSLLLKLEPSYINETEVRGIWGLLNGVSDTTMEEETLVELDIDVMKLCDASEYNTRAEVKNSLENGGP